jgi:hypothetical protein
MVEICGLKKGPQNFGLVHSLKINVVDFKAI